METSHLELSFPRSLTLCMSDCGSLHLLLSDTIALIYLIYPMVIGDKRVWNLIAVECRAPKTLEKRSKGSM